MKESDATDIPLQPRPLGHAVPLTRAQLAAWNHITAQGARLSGFRFCAIRSRVLGPLDVCFLRTSIEALVQRHESLRTRIVTGDGVPRQHIDAVRDCQFEFIDLTSASQTDAEAQARNLAQSFADEAIDLSVGPIFAAKLFRLARHDHVFIVAMDHMFSDARSFGIINKETWALYRQAIQGQSLSLPPLPIQFPDYAVWQERAYHGWVRNHEAYWRNRLTGAGCTQLPLDHGPADEKCSTAPMMHIPFGKALSADLREVARREQTPLPLVVMAVYTAVMSRWCNQEDLVIEFVSHGRHGRPELENMIGPLASSIFLRIQVKKEDNLIDLLRRVNLEFHSACKHQAFGSVREIVPECITDLFFNWVTTNWLRRPADQDMKAETSLRMQLFPIRPAIAFRSIEPSRKLKTEFCETAAGIVAIVRYQASLFMPGTIERLGYNLRFFANQLAQHPHTSIVSATCVS